MKGTGIAPTLDVGARGQFDVLVDGVVIASRHKGLLTRILGGGWPDVGDVVEKVKERQQLAR